ncbi:MAG: hypothetical protein EOP83_16365 [Verrucomicrobiaceae bacterium]|nr:MAG: hypothetical protein EOP83_16365 [Verrucomicrobiaceae bacterium]
MKRTYKLIASRGNEIVFDDRLEADSPRDARRELKKLLGLESLSGIVYSITEIPVDLIREIVDARIAELRLNPILRRLAALERPEALARPMRFDPLAMLPDNPPGPDWNLVKRHFRRYGDPHKTAGKYRISLGELNDRAGREGWAS